MSILPELERGHSSVSGNNCGLFGFRVTVGRCTYKDRSLCERIEGRVYQVVTTASGSSRLNSFHSFDCLDYYKIGEKKFYVWNEMTCDNPSLSNHGEVQVSSLLRQGQKIEDRCACSICEKCLVLSIGS